MFEQSTIVFSIVEFVSNDQASYSQNVQFPTMHPESSGSHTKSIYTLPRPPMQHTVYYTPRHPVFTQLTVRVKTLRP